MKYFFYLFIVSSFLPLTIFAESKLSSNKIYLDEKASITFNISPIPSSAEVIQIPKVKGLEVEGPYQSTEIQIINFNKTENLKLIFYIYSNKTGVFNIPPIKLSIDGKTVLGSKHKLQVLAIPKNQKNNNKKNNNFNPFSNSAWKDFFGSNKPKYSKQYELKGDALSSLILTNNHPFQGELIGAYYLIAFKNFSEAQINTSKSKFPKWKGFYSETFTSDNDIQNKKILAYGYNNAIFTRKKFLVALKPGKVKIESHYIYLQDVNDFASPSKAFISEKTINVKSLPEENKPENFSGNIGNFTYEYELKENKFYQYKPFTIVLKISGQGNFIHFSKPEFETNNNISNIGINIIENKMLKSVSKLSGNAIIEYKFNSSISGKFSPGKFKLNWFNPKTKKYYKKILLIPALVFKKSFLKKTSIKNEKQLNSNNWIISIFLVTIFLFLLFLVFWKFKIADRMKLRIQNTVTRTLDKKIHIQENSPKKLLQKMSGEKKGLILEHYLLENGLNEEEIIVFFNLQKKLYNDSYWKSKVVLTQKEEKLVDKLKMLIK